MQNINNMQKDRINFIFFGTPNFSVEVLKTLEEKNFTPSAVVTSPDKPKGRQLALSPSPVKEWAKMKGVQIFEPSTLKDPSIVTELKIFKPDLFVVASYGKIIPEDILSIPKFGTLNIHPSLLPRWRGASPIQAAILNDEKTGVTIMLLDKEMDHGPVLAQKVIQPTGGWPPYVDEFEIELAREGAQLLAETMFPWLKGTIEVKEQSHEEATYCGRIDKSNGLINLNNDPRENFLKIRAFRKNPGAYTFIKNKGGEDMRVKILEADLEEGNLRILKVIPEGRKEMSWDDFERGFLLH